MILLRLRIVLSQWLLKLSNTLHGYSNKLMVKPSQLFKQKEETDLFAPFHKEEVEFPYAFKTFKEGLSSKNYITRHDAAASLVSWYVNEQGQPHIDDITQAARVLLENTNAAEKDISLLVDAWFNQAIAKTEEERIEADKLEEKIFSDLATKHN